MVKASDNWNTTTQCLLVQQLKQWILFLRSSPFHHGEHFSLKGENIISITTPTSSFSSLNESSVFWQHCETHSNSKFNSILWLSWGVWDLSPLRLCWNRKDSKNLLTKAFFLITLRSLESTKHLPIYNKMILTIKDAYWLRTECIHRFFPVK